MDVRSMCSSSSVSSDPSDQSDKNKVSGFASHVQSLPSPPLMDTVNQKKGSSLPPLTTILPPLHEINPNSLPPPQKQPHNDTSSSTENLYDKSSNPKSPSRVNYPQPPVQSISQRSSLTSPLSSSSYSSQSSNDNTNMMWLRQPPPHPTSYYHQSFPPPPQPPPPPSSSSQYSYTPQSQQPQQQSIRHYPYPSAIYPPAYATSTSYNSSGNNIGDDDDDSPYITQTVEQSIAKMGKAVDHCNQIAHFATQYRDMRMYNQWDGIFQVSESALTDMINRAFDILNILSGLKGEISSRRSNASHNEIDLIRKQRTLGASTRSKYRKRSKRAAPPGRCHSCNISETPEWRRGPDGARTLCNACGLHFAKITRKRALSAMQQAEQQQQQRVGQQQEQQQQTIGSPSPSENSNVSDNSNISSSMTTPSTSDVEKDNNTQSIEIIDD